MMNTFDSEYEIRIPITNGQFNFEDVEDTAFGFGDAYVGFTYTEPEYGGAIPGRFHIEMGLSTDLWWNLTPEEAILASNDMIRISTLIKQSPHQRPPRPDDDPPSRSISSLRYRRVDIDLRLPGQTEIKLGNAGSLTLGGGDGLPFRFTAQHDDPDAFVRSLPLQLSADVEKMNLKTDELGGKLTTGHISISSVGRARLSFAAGNVGLNTMDLPRTLEGTTDECTAKDILWTPGASKEKKK